MPDMKHDDSGVTAMLEYLITFVLAFIIFTMMLSMFDGMFIRGPQEAVSAVQFADVGNDVTAKILDTYLIAPPNGKVYTFFDMPETIAGKGYTLDVRESANGWDKEVVVYSNYTSMVMSVTINGVTSTIPIAGSTSSMSSAHAVRYDNEKD
jgi:hypothetical protein